MSFRILLSILCIALGVCLFQNTYSQGAYLPQNLGKNVNSAYDEINPVLSHDGKTLYFTRLNHPDNYYGRFYSGDIWYSTLQKDGKWSEAKRMPDYINVNRYNAVLSVTQDNNSLLLLGHLSKKFKVYKTGVSLITRIADSVWSEPEPIIIPGIKKLSEGQNMQAYLSYDGVTLLLSISKRYNSKKNDLYVTIKEGDHWLKPMHLGKTINTRKYSEEAPFLSKNNEWLYFSSNRPISKQNKEKNNFNIYKAKRTTVGWKNWTEPELLSDTINTIGYESYFKTNNKGNYAYYVSSKDTLFGGTDIYKIKLKEENPYILISGKIYSSITGQLFNNKKNYTITVNGLAWDSVRISFDSASFRLRLPFGKMYYFGVKLDNYISYYDTLNATRINEFTELNRNLFVKPLPYVQLTGVFIDKNTGLAIPSSSAPKLVVNGAVIDSVKIDKATSAYFTRLLYGKSYTLSMLAPSYNPIIDTLDLRNVTEYKEVSKNLLAEKVIVIEKPKGVIVAGRVIDKKTNQPIASTIPFNVVVDSMPSLAPSVNSMTAEFNMLLPPGKKYTIGAKAEKYYAVYEMLDLTKMKDGDRVFKDLILAPIQIGQAIRMNNVFFESGRAVLKPESFPELDKLAKFLIDNPSIKVEIAGHTDNVGNKENNLKLSRWRARSCELYIESKGVDPERVSFNGYGDTKPVADNKTAAGKALNRRVEFVIKGLE